MGHSVTSGHESVSVPSGTERARAFLPSQDFDVSKAFYVALGFTMVLEGDVAIFATGESEIILTRFYQKEYAENFMIRYSLMTWKRGGTTSPLLIYPRDSEFPLQRSQRCNRGA